MIRNRLYRFIPIAYESSNLATVLNNEMMAFRSKNVLIAGAGRPEAFRGVSLIAGKQGSRYLTQAGDSFAGLGKFSESIGKGSVVRVMAGLFFAGSGTLFYDGQDLTTTASSILQLKLLSSGAFGTTYQAGLSQPSAPTLVTRSSLGPGMTGRLKAGSYSAVVYKIRTATGARSVASPPSEIIVAVENNNIGQSARLTFPAADVNGGDRWGVCVTPRGFGSTGPHFLLKEVPESALTTIDSVPRSIEIEWTDADLAGKPLAPVDSYPPPSCVFVGALGNSVFVDGAYGDITLGVAATNPGTVIACSLPLHPEEFPLDWLAFPPDAPTCLLRGGDGFYYRFGANSLGVVSFTGGEPPIRYQLYWGSTGVRYQHNAVVAEGGRLYAKTGEKGIVRIGNNGEPEMLWASKISRELEGKNDADIVLGWDENYQQVCVCVGTIIYPFNSTLDKWGAPLDLTNQLPGPIVSAVTHLGSLYLSALDPPNNTIRLYKFNSGSGSLMEVRTDWLLAEDTAYIRAIQVAGRFDTTNPVTVRVYKNFDELTPIFETQQTPIATRPYELPSIRTIIPDLRSFQIAVLQQTGGQDAAIEQVDVYGWYKKTTR
jgi:hypothetical protein